VKLTDTDSNYVHHPVTNLDQGLGLVSSRTQANVLVSSRAQGLVLGVSLGPLGLVHIPADMPLAIQDRQYGKIYP